jgi:type IV secretory pathway VirB4 component
MLCSDPAFNTLGISRMTSVLNAGGLNYQNGNPVRLGIEANRNEIGELRKVVEALTVDLGVVKARLAIAEKDATAAKASAAEAKATIAAAAVSASQVSSG